MLWGELANQNDFPINCACSRQKNATPSPASLPFPSVICGLDRPNYSRTWEIRKLTCVYECFLSIFYCCVAQRPCSWCYILKFGECRMISRLFGRWLCERYKISRWSDAISHSMNQSSSIKKSFLKGKKVCCPKFLSSDNFANF